jgi:hypothetical protein
LALFSVAQTSSVKENFLFHSANNSGGVDHSHVFDEKWTDRPARLRWAAWRHAGEQ